MTRSRVQAASVYCFALIGLSLLVGAGMARAEAGSSATQASSSTTEVSSSGDSDVSIESRQESQQSVGGLSSDQAAGPAPGTAVDDSQSAGAGSQSSEDASQPVESGDQYTATTEAASQTASGSNYASPARPASFQLAVADTSHSRQMMQKANTPAPFQASPGAGTPTSPSDPAPELPAGGLHRLTDALGASVMPLLILLAVMAAAVLTFVSLSGAPAALPVLVGLAVGGWFVSQLRRSGYRHAPRSDAGNTSFFATPPKVGFAWSPERPAASPSFMLTREAETNLRPQRYKKGGEYYAYQTNSS